ncbi:hypothetical protein DPMN_074651 [Dreissena polymorpha]|uniref:Uncharacterized protein n=1 Tax=Dreissena polymorpha TaxID=45954 RepID=A0A9D4BLW7_DREPO|nr:hypothetical protein DPMN_074651 [Dreissena polymorpha]
MYLLIRLLSDEANVALRKRTAGYGAATDSLPATPAENHARPDCQVVVIVQAGRGIRNGTTETD